MKDSYRIIGLVFVMVVLNGFIFVVKSQVIDSMATDTVMSERQNSTVNQLLQVQDTTARPMLEVQDSMAYLLQPEVDARGQIVVKASTDSVRIISVSDSIVKSTKQQIDSIFIPAPKTFKPNPTTSVIFSAIFPGLGQIYNRKYWKLPIVYGGFLGLTYAITWNNKNLQDYGRAYKDLSYDLLNNKDKPENWAQSWKDFIPAGSNPANRFNENFKTQLKSGRDYYRRWRDLSIILTVGVYFICMADAYVDAQLFDFDISPDLSLHVEPVVNPGINAYPRLYGFNCSINF